MYSPLSGQTIVQPTFRQSHSSSPNLETFASLSSLSNPETMPLERDASDANRVRPLLVSGWNISSLSEQRKSGIRSLITSSLRRRETTKLLWKDGALGLLFPEHFGDFEKFGGITDRPQHGGHHFAVDEHILLVMDRVREHALFQRLSLADQENVLIAAMMHDVAKEANVVDPNHEYEGARVTVQLLQRLGYEYSRVRKIAKLIARHSEVSYVPGVLNSERLQNQQQLTELAQYYSDPSALPQLRILNESDIRSIAKNAVYWTPEVETEVELVQSMVETALAQIQNASQ